MYDLVIQPFSFVYLLLIKSKLTVLLRHIRFGRFVDRTFHFFPFPQHYLSHKAFLSLICLLLFDVSFKDRSFQQLHNVSHTPNSQSSLPTGDPRRHQHGGGAQLDVSAAAAAGPAVLQRAGLPRALARRRLDQVLQDLRRRRQAEGGEWCCVWV